MYWWFMARIVGVSWFGVRVVEVEKVEEEEGEEGAELSFCFLPGPALNAYVK